MTTNHIPAITYPTILMAVFANQLCLPIPAVLFLITAGALVAGGSLNLVSVILAGVVGCLLADYAWFLAGRWWGHRVVRALCAFSMDGQHCAEGSEALRATGSAELNVREIRSRSGRPDAAISGDAECGERSVPPLRRSRRH